jgi:hypothetical protein
VTAVTGGVYSAKWDGGSWSVPERIEDRPMDPHAQSLVVCGGNELQVVYDDRMGENTTVWWSRRKLDTPSLSGTPLHRPSEVSSGMPTIAEPASLASGPRPEVVDGAQGSLADDLHTAASPSYRAMVQPLVVSSVAAVAVIAGAAIIVRKRRV